MKKIISILLALIFVFSFAACGEEKTVKEDDTNKENEKVLGEWWVGGIYYGDLEDNDGVHHKDLLYDINDNDALADLYDTNVLTFKNDGTFVYLGLINKRGAYSKYSSDDDNVYILKVTEYFTYDIQNGELVEQEKASSKYVEYLATLVDEVTIKLEEYDSTTDEFTDSDRHALFFVKENEESSYIANNKKEIGDDSSSTTEATTKKVTTTTAFTNKYGTRTTLCAHSGCTNYIATSGDTNCCPSHSQRCLNCGCYIDEDAMYCMSCLEKAASKSTTSSYSYSNDCYICGSSATQKVGSYWYCDKHAAMVKAMAG